MSAQHPTYEPAVVPGPPVPRAVVVAEAARAATAALADATATLHTPTSSASVPLDNLLRARALADGIARSRSPLRGRIPAEEGASARSGPADIEYVPRVAPPAPALALLPRSLVKAVPQLASLRGVALEPESVGAARPPSPARLRRAASPSRSKSPGAPRRLAPGARPESPLGSGQPAQSVLAPACAHPPLGAEDNNSHTQPEPPYPVFTPPSAPPLYGRSVVPPAGATLPPIPRGAAGGAPAAGAPAYSVPSRPAPAQLCATSSGGSSQAVPFAAEVQSEEPEFTFAPHSASVQPTPMLPPFPAFGATASEPQHACAPAAEALEAAPGSKLFARPPASHTQPAAAAAATSSAASSVGAKRLVSRETQTVESELAASAPARRYINPGGGIAETDAQRVAAARLAAQAVSAEEVEEEDSWLRWWYKARLC